MDPRCHIVLFGPVRLRSADRAVAHFRYRKAAHLLACLALLPGRSYTREALVDRFWPEMEIDAGRDNLSKALSSLRRELEQEPIAPGAVLVADRVSVSLSPGMVSTDVQECDELLRQAHLTSDPAARSELLGRAVGLCQGDLVSDCYDEWIEPDRRRWAERRMDAHVAWAHALVEAGDLPGALDVAADAAAIDPLREDACVLRMQIYSALRRPGDVIACLREYEHRLAEEAGSELPFALLERAQALAASGDAGMPANPAAAGEIEQPPAPLAPSSMRYPHSAAPRLPAPPVAVDRYFGRRRELESLTRWLSVDADDADRARLVTLTGSGGTGKTRLALEAARLLSTPYQGRVAFVPLENVDDPARFGVAVARGLGVGCGPSDDPLEAIAVMLGATPALLVLDNLEQLLGESPQGDVRGGVSRLLELMPGTRVLATSRQSLALRGEREMRLLPLATPAGAGADCESVALFVDRARGVVPTFEVNAQNREDVAALCDYLEGSPLAIEMAAAWVRILPPPTLLERLQRSADGLFDRRKDIPRRHRTLRATLDWSHHLLAPDLREAFAALSVFRGGWSLQAAEAVIGDAALVALAELEERSLVVANRDTGRFRYLETVRQYASERLRDAGANRARERHARYFVRKFECVSVASPALQRPGWNSLRHDYPNLIVALEWLAESGQTEDLARAFASLEGLWRSEGHHLRDGDHWADRVTTLHLRRDSARAAALLTAGSVATALGRWELGRRRYREAVSIANRHGDRGAVVSGAFRMAGACAAGGDPVRARRLAEYGRTLLGDLEGDAPRADALLMLGNVLGATGDTSAREGALRECAAVARRAGLRSPLAHALYGLSALARERNDLDAAAVLLKECLAADEMDGVQGGAAIWALGQIAEQRGETALAGRWYRRFLRESLQALNPCGVLEGLYCMALDALRRKEMDRAARLMGALLRLEDETDLQQRPAHRKSVDGALAQLRERLGADTCDALLEAGWQMPVEATIDLALEHLQPNQG